MTGPDDKDNMRSETLLSLGYIIFHTEELFPLTNKTKTWNVLSELFLESTHCQGTPQSKSSTAKIPFWVLQHILTPSLS
jgi:hypothetical protein